MHVENRLASVDKAEQGKITKLLDLDNPLPTEDRLKELEMLLNTKVVEPLSAINTENDLLTYIKAQPTLNAIPLIVKQYFSL